MKRFLYKTVELKKIYMPILNPRNSVLKYLEFGVLLLPKKESTLKAKPSTVNML